MRSLSVLSLFGAVLLASVATADPVTSYIYINRRKEADSSSLFPSLFGATVKNESLSSDIVGTAVFEDLTKSEGWERLVITPQQSLLASDNDTKVLQAWYIAGFAEGFASFRSIANVYNYGNYTNDPLTASFMEKHITYMQNQSDTNTVDPFWKQVRRVFALLRGISAGYTSRVPAMPDMPTISFADIIRLNLDNEMTDFTAAAHCNHPSFDRVVEEVQAKHAAEDKCSALIKLTDQELFFSQVTWSGYGRFIGRQYKTYHLGVNVSLTANAGHIASGDDYYITSNKLAVMETTFEFMNKSLYCEIQSHSVSGFIRVMVANTLAENTSDWVKHFKNYHSGTYCNQWMVLDYKLYQRGNNTLPPGTFRVYEELPGPYDDESDMTHHLQNYTYWPSYNLPYFKGVYNVSGYYGMAEYYGSFFSYEDTPRAKIFRRDHDKVKDLKTMQKMMRYNDYENDELSIIPDCNLCNPKYNAKLAIASRADLNSPTAEFGDLSPMVSRYLSYNAFGATDAKITNAHMMDYMVSDIVQGPTHDQQPVFSWGEFAEGSSMAKKGKLQGMPTNYDYEFKTWNENGPYTIPKPPFDSTQGKRIMGGVIGGCTAALLLSIFLVWYTQHRPMAKHVPLA